MKIYLQKLVRNRSCATCFVLRMSRLIRHGIRAFRNTLGTLDWRLPNSGKYYYRTVRLHHFSFHSTPPALIDAI